MNLYIFFWSISLIQKDKDLLAQSSPYTYKRNDFVKTKDQRELARFGLARTDDKPRVLSSSLEYCRGAEEEDEVKTSVFIRTFLTLSKNHQ